MKSLLGSLLLVLAVFALVGCKPKPTPPPVITGCPGSNAGPSFRVGSQDLAPTIVVIPPSQPVPKALIVSMSGTPSLQLDVGGPVIGSVFEMCVVTNPPAKNTHLGVDVTGVLEDPSASGAAGGGPVNYWQNVFSTFFVRPLQDDQTDGNGVLKIDVPAQNLRNALSSPPAGYSSGRMLITVQLSDGLHKMDLTLTPK